MRPGDLRGYWRWVVVAAAGAGGSFVASIPWLGAYRTASLWPALVVASAVPAAITLGAVLARRGALLSYAASGAGLVVLLLVAASSDPARIARGVATGPSHLLTDTLPLGAPRWLMVPALLVAWMTAAAVAEIALRGRSAGPALGVLAASYAGAYALTSAAPQRPVAAGALLFASGAALAMSKRLLTQAPVVAGHDGERAPAGRSHPRMRAAAGGSAFAAAVAVVAWLGVPHLPGLHAAGVALARRPPTANPLATSPVDVIAALRDDHPHSPPLTMVEVRAATPSDGYLPVAVLDHYDGAIWTFDSTFEPSGGRVPEPGAGPRSEGPVARQQIDMVRPLGPSVPLIPYADRPTRVTGIGIDADASTGMVVPSGTTLFPLRYSVTSQGFLGGLRSLPASARFAGVPGGADTQLPSGALSDLTGTLQYLASLTGERPAPTVAFMQSLERALRRDDRRVDPLLAPPSAAPPTRGGTSLAEVISATTVSQEATPEQFATLFVVVARALGVPARLVTGFRVLPQGGVAPAGSYTITDRQAWTWAELPVQGKGWVIVDPTPSLTATEAPPPAVAATSTPSTTVAPPQANALPSNTPGTHALAPPAPAPPRPPPPAPLGLWIAGGVLALAVAAPSGVFAAAWGRRRVRRRMRRRAEPRALAVGAWLEVLDALSRAGVDPGSSATAAEVAAMAGRSFGPDMEERVQGVGTLADLALCSTFRQLEPAAARASWDSSRQVARELPGHLGRRQRARAALAVGRNPRRPFTAGTII